MRKRVFTLGTDARIRESVHTLTDPRVRPQCEHPFSHFFAVIGTLQIFNLTTTAMMLSDYARTTWATTAGMDRSGEAQLHDETG